MAYTITDSCIGCTLCAKQCPVGAITGTLKEKHHINPDRCLDCGLCGKICPKEAILDGHGAPTKKIPKEQWKKPVVDEESCAGCSVCVINCPKDCLEIEGPKFHGDIHTVAKLVGESNCIGCGICADSCPIEAIKMAK